MFETQTKTQMSKSVKVDDLLLILYSNQWLLSLQVPCS